MKILICFLLPVVSWAQTRLETVELINDNTPGSILPYSAASTKLHDRELKQRRETSLGDTLRNEVSVSSTNFGPNSGRPIIRGLDGERVKILQNGLSVLDASSQSVDHAVPVDTIVIDSIEIARGPMALLYGTSAIGGIVNVMTNRIHHTFEPGNVQELQVQGDSAQNGMATGARLDYGKDQWMFHLDGAYRNANDQQYPKLVNSSQVQKSGAVGISRIFSRGYVGVSLYGLDNNYGTIKEEDVRIRMKQNRLEVHGEYRFEGNHLKSIRLRTAQSDYSHKELSGHTVGTTFLNEGNETRLEVNSLLGNVKGVTGLQSQMFNFKAIGEESFLPPSRTNVLSAFTLQQLQTGAQEYSLGARFENSHVQNQGLESSKNFNGLSSSFGVGHQLAENLKLVSSASYTQRAPNFQELYASGPHVATGIVERGESGLKKETAYSLEAGLRYETKESQYALTVYGQRFQHFITLVGTGEVEDGLDVFAYEQVGARLYGAEFQGRQGLGDDFYLLTKADYVRGQDTDTGRNLPRITQPRTSLGIQKVKDLWSYDLEGQYNFEQTKTAPIESHTRAFTLVNAGVTRDFILNNVKWSLFGRVKNILNQEARLHTSFIKDVAPLPGRNVVVGLQCIF